MAKKIVTRTPEEALQLWIDALRSGKYRKCRYQLHRKSCYCAQGVLLDLIKKDGGPGWSSVKEADGSKIYLSELNGSPYSLDDKVINFLGLKSSHVEKIQCMNDYESASFKEIADYIETEILKKG